MTLQQIRQEYKTSRRFCSLILQIDLPENVRSGIGGNHITLPMQGIRYPDRLPLIKGL